MGKVNQNGVPWPGVLFGESWVRASSSARLLSPSTGKQEGKRARLFLRSQHCPGEIPLFHPPRVFLAGELPPEALRLYGGAPARCAPQRVYTPGRCAQARSRPFSPGLQKLPVFHHAHRLGMVTRSCSPACAVSSSAKLASCKQGTIKVSPSVSI